MLRQARMHFANTPRAFRIVVIVAACVFASVFGTWRYTESPHELLEQHAYKQHGGAYRIPKGKLPSVNLVVAATMAEDYSWVKDLKMPGLMVVPYIADNETAPYHPRKNKGHEAGIYLQYFYDFYDNLPDISILIHSHKSAWHVDNLLEQSMEFSLNHLDLRHVQRRGFTNLRVTWGNGCEDNGINTTLANIENFWHPEIPLMQESFRANFNLYDVPEVLASPCCSQIAVTKEMVRKVPKEQFEHHIQWLLNTELDDSLSGRVWEHMWQYLFLGKPVECPLEYSAYCALYHICFDGRSEYDEYVELQQGRESLEHELEELDRVVEKAELKRKNGKGGEKVDDDVADENGARNGDEDSDEARGDEDDMDAREQEDRVGKSLDEQYKETMRTVRATKKWLVDELEPIKAAIRVRKEVAVVRGSVEANRMAVWDELYNDEELLPMKAVPTIL